ncbi:MAG TPA: hypothetical protein VGO63_00145 [Candidatus Paceibacterota bacterium]|jgi:hypothetical protein|nr:hypothetical protein [Candidatus Paceibacterota bacterium]
MKEGGVIEQIQNKVSYHKDRLHRDYIPAWKERRATDRIPPLVEKNLAPEEAGILAESLITSSQLLRLHNGIEPLQEGSYLFHESAGTVKDATRHVHEFIIQKKSSDTQLYYIDPEHTMGKSKNRSPLGIPRIGDLRPQVHVLYSAQLSPHGKIERISILRYRAAVIPEDQHHLNTPKEQFEMAKTILEKGTLPEILKGKENEITFWLDFRSTGDKYKIHAQARAAGDVQAIEKMLENLMKGQTMSSDDPLEGQLRRYRGIMRTYFPKYLEEKRFNPYSATK